MAIIHLRRCLYKDGPIQPGTGTAWPSSVPTGQWTVLCQPFCVCHHPCYSKLGLEFQIFSSVKLEYLKVSGKIKGERKRVLSNSLEQSPACGSLPTRALSWDCLTKEAPARIWCRVQNLTSSVFTCEEHQQYLLSRGRPLDEGAWRGRGLGFIK